MSKIHANNMFFIQDKNDQPIKIMAQYHQYFGVIKALNSVLKAEKPRCDIFEMDSLQTSSLRNAFNDKTYIYAMQKNLETITKCLISK